MDPRAPQFKPMLRIEDMSFGAGPGAVRPTTAYVRPSADGVAAPPARDKSEMLLHRGRLALRS
jgi:hypothetical protein